jgi:uncharacterized coiled-coil DUF342 family protein
MSRKTIVELAQRSEDMRCLEEAKEDLDKIKQENDRYKEEAVEWGEWADELETNVKKILANRAAYKGAKAAAITWYKAADKICLAVRLDIAKEELAKAAIERQEGGGSDEAMKTLKGLFETAKNILRRSSRG